MGAGDQLARRRDAGGLDPVLRLGLHHLAEAADAAEHRHRRRRRRLPAADRLGGGDRRRDRCCRCCCSRSSSCGRRRISGRCRCSSAPIMPTPACRCCRWSPAPRVTRQQIVALHAADGGRRGRALAARPGRRDLRHRRRRAQRSPSSCCRCTVLANRATEPAAMKPEKRLFAFSILYLFALFGALVVDRWLLGMIPVEPDRRDRPRPPAPPRHRDGARARRVRHADVLRSPSPR